MSAALAFLAIDVAAVVCAALAALRAFGLGRRDPAWRLVGLIALNTACGVVLAHQEYGYWMPAAFRIDVGAWAIVLNLARNLTPGLIMWLCHAAFTERPRPPAWLLALLALQMGLEAFGDALGGRLLSQTAPALLQSLFVAAGLYWTLADWRVDLVERRRRLRAGMLAAIGLVTLAGVLLPRVLVDPDSEASYLVHVALTASYLPLLAAALLLDLGIGAAAPVATPRRRAADDDGPALARLKALLDEAQVCLEPDLTLAGLARRVAVPEYRLRRLIHEGLGYRNFNALLHDYRIREACRQLRDPDLRRTPILTIALSVGYSSVNTFNRGFREIMRVTPSAYRATE